ncbi:MAG TPA: ice-binding family protein, partial [Bryobacteraceae bacterium]|nr:ice-binding family protein [Bryobacteraceae bacterium]
MMNLRTYLLCAMFAQFLMVENAAAQQAPVPLRTASAYGVLAGSTITNTGATTINGDVGLSPGTAVTGFPPGTVVGTTRTAAAAAPAQAGLVTAYNDAAGRTPVTTVATELGGQTLVAGVYNSAAGTFGITGILTLDGQNDANAVFIFQAASTLTTAAGAPGNPASQVVLINGAQPCNIFWQVGSSATLGTYSVFQGSILALTSITVTTGATINGRVLARNGAVTLDTNTITTSVCAAPPVQGGGPTPPLLADLAIAKTHLGNFTRGQTGATYTIMVSNVGSAPPTGSVTVSDVLPTGLTATAISGPGWSCTLTGLTCTRSDALAAGASYPIVTLTVNVGTDVPAS